MRVESAEASERQRNQAAIEQQRLQHEMEIRRAEVAKKRPTWMLAVTGLALVAAVGLVFFAIQRKKDSDEAAERTAIAERAAAAAVKDAAEAKEKLEKVEKDMDDLTNQINKAINDLAVAQ